MTMNNVFTDARDVQIGHNAHIQSVSGNLTTTTNTYYNDRGDTVELYGNTFRKILMGDIIVRRDVSSQVLEVVMETKHQGLDRGESQQRSKVTRVRKTMQHVEVMGLPGSFTSIAIEKMDGTQEGLDIISKRVCRELASRRLALFPQLVGIGQSKHLTWIVHDELANGEEFAIKMWAEGSQVVWYYLWHTCTTSFLALRADTTLRIPVLGKWRFWTFNRKTHAWHYDIAFISLFQPNIDLSSNPFFYPPTPLRHETPPRLNPTEIVAYFENQLGDFLHVIASSGQTRRVEDLSAFARHGLLTFGAVVDRNQPEIIAHFPLTPSPQWYFKNFSAGVEATYSTSVPYRIDFCSDQPGVPVNVNLHFSWCLPDLLQRTAYLAQSVPFAVGCHDSLNDLVFITDKICIGTLVSRADTGPFF
ncbi:hypothetical protein PM082_024736 [Marasmius tenuissimus]|nr:hypothetical protein PM082_024736 [Marasmius tenuissimus]